MTFFLTSSPCVVGACRFSNANGFLDALRSAVPHPCRFLYICSSPDDREKNEFYSEEMRECFEAAGFEFTQYNLLDRRNEADTPVLVRNADLIFLAGGHVPTQNQFLRHIGLRELMADFGGVVMGISAGSMNCADVVYAQPEMEGEATDPAYERFLPGLGLTKAQILPHYQMLKDDILDGMRLFEDISFGDSMGRKFYTLVDGSFILGKNGREELRGLAYLIQDGHMEQICEENQTIYL